MSFSGQIRTKNGQTKTTFLGNTPVYIVPDWTVLLKTTTTVLVSFYEEGTNVPE